MTWLFVIYSVAYYSCICRVALSKPFIILVFKGTVAPDSLVSFLACKNRSGPEYVCTSTGLKNFP